MVMNSVCFKVVQTHTDRILYYFHGPYQTGRKAWIVASQLYELHEKSHQKFLEHWQGREIKDLDVLRFEDLKGLIGDNAVLDMAQDGTTKICTIIGIKPPRPDDPRRLYIKPKITLPYMLRPEVLDPTVHVQDVKRAEFKKRFFGIEASHASR